jgi:CRISPR-associated endonuclease/helicase Cas3
MSDLRFPAPVLPKTNFVYTDASLLWRSAEAIFTAGKIASRTSVARAPVESGEVRALIEAVYSDDIPAIPPSLERAEIRALGVHSGERTQAHYSTLNFHKGYDWDGMKWERDTRVKTRLGEDTITLRLARMEDGTVVPWMPIEGGDVRRAWALSEVNLSTPDTADSAVSPSSARSRRGVQA